MPACSKYDVFVQETHLRATLAPKMKAIRVHQFGGPEVLQLEDVSEPKPGLTQVLVRARAIGVDPSIKEFMLGEFRRMDVWKANQKGTKGRRDKGTK